MFCHQMWSNIERIFIQYKRKSLKRTQKTKMYINLILNKSKAICRQKITKCSCAKKDSLSRDVFITPRNLEHKIKQSFA